MHTCGPGEEFGLQKSVCVQFECDCPKKKKGNFAYSASALDVIFVSLKRAIRHEVEGERESAGAVPPYLVCYPTHAGVRTRISVREAGSIKLGRGG